MPRARTALLAALLALPAFAPASEAAMFSKTYVFKPDTTLEIGVEVESGLRLDTVRFDLPATADGKVVRTAGLVQARVALSNTSGGARKVGFAVALYDDENRLLGVASCGIGLFPLKSGRQGTYSCTFENVNAEIPRATKFQITIEPKP